ncbi:hypothetical protein ACFX1S_043671 [Malus domestica]
MSNTHASFPSSPVVTPFVKTQLGFFLGGDHSLDPNRPDLNRRPRQGQKHGLTFRDFHLHQSIGAGDISTVYLCTLRISDSSSSADQDTESSSFSWLYAMKVVDNEALAMKKKVQRTEIERKILKMLDHLFFPTFYAEFEASHFSCIVME